MEKQAAINVLIETMNDTHLNLQIRIGAARGLGRIYGPESRSALAQVMRSHLNHVDLRAAAAEALGGAAAS